MISWMQKHNKYLIVTIWIATIAFIGAGFVGWGSYSYGSKVSAIAQVGDVDIKKAKWDMTYSNLYQQYNQMLNGKFDEAQAKEMGLSQQAFKTVETQARLLNLANEFGIIISDDELAEKIANIKGFQKNGIFNKTIYTSYLRNMRMKANLFEEILKDDFKIEKLLSMLNSDSSSFEQSFLVNAFNVSDKIKYQVITPNDINITIDENGLQKYWQEHKSEYMVPQKYVLDMLWTESQNIVVSTAEVEDFYKNNSFNYIEDGGKQLTLTEANSTLIQDLKLKKVKKDAQKKYIAFKKGKIEKSETVTIAVDSLKLTSEIWDEIKLRSINDILKPKIVGDKFVSLKIIKILDSKEMTFKEAKELAIPQYKALLSSESMSKMAENKLNDIKDSNESLISEYITLDKPIQLKKLSDIENKDFMQKLFISNKEKGIITVRNKMIIYNIIDQKISSIDSNNTNMILDTMNQMKKSDFQSSLLEDLEKKYETKMYIKGL